MYIDYVFAWSLLTNPVLCVVYDVWQTSRSYLQQNTQIDMCSLCEIFSVTLTRLFCC